MRARPGADLGVHLPQGRLGGVEVPRGAGQTPAGLPVGELHVGHVDVDHAAQEPEGGQGLIAPAVVDQGETQTPAAAIASAARMAGRWGVGVTRLTLSHPRT